MSTRKPEILLILVFLSLASGMPQENGNNQDTGFGLPFLQLTNGGIRFNFGGYHAEAGLGGLLGGSKLGGGLHASAGTPWGAHAAAGLGGVLGGDDATAGGGLYARAGLGNGRPEAGAGLGGMLNGSGRSNVPPAAGGLFAGATTGSRTSSTVFGGGGASASSDATAGAAGTGDGSGPGSGTGKKSSTGGTSIQIVSRGGKNPETSKQVEAQATLTSSNQANYNSESPQDKVVQGQISPVESGLTAVAGLFGGLGFEPITGGVVKSVEKVKTAGGSGQFIRESSLSDVPSVAEIESANEVDSRIYKKAPRWFLRRKLRAERQRKQLTAGNIAEINAAADSEESTKNNRRVVRQDQNGAVDQTTFDPNDSQQTQNGKRGGSFDDIFNIPISTLTAVNQLVRNNAG